MSRRKESEPNTQMQILNIVGGFLTVPKDTSRALSFLQAVADGANLNSLLTITLQGHEPDFKKACIGLAATRILTHCLTYLPKIIRI